MIRVIYTSSAREGLTELEIQSIIQTSQKNNNEKGFTGLLLCRPTLFLQIIEGDDKRVMDLIDKIKKDNRHSEMEIMCKSQIEKRAFKEWTSAKMIEETQNQSYELDPLTKGLIEQNSIMSNAEGKLVKACLNLACH